jgi:GTP-binding protein HflX
MIEVWNKIDLMAPDARERGRAAAAARDDARRPYFVSAVTGEGVEALLAGVEEKLASGNPVFEVRVAPEDGQGLAWLHDTVEVLSRKTTRAGATKLVVRVSPRQADKLRARFPKAVETTG